MFSENEGADQLCGYRTADLRLCFRICKKKRFSHDAAHYTRRFTIHVHASRKRTTVKCQINLQVRAGFCFPFWHMLKQIFSRCGFIMNNYFDSFHVSLHYVSPDSSVRRRKIKSYVQSVLIEPVSMTKVNTVPRALRHNSSC